MICESVDQVKDQRAMIGDLMRYQHDPLRAVKYGFKWGEGDLAHSAGPRRWQAQLFRDIGEHLQNPATQFKPFKGCVSSGHGIGKSAGLGMLSWWGLSTSVDCRINITANTKGQLDTKTSPEFDIWFRRAINSDWFEVNVSSIRVPVPPLDPPGFREGS